MIAGFYTLQNLLKDLRSIISKIKHDRHKCVVVSLERRAARRLIRPRSVRRRARLALKTRVSDREFRQSETHSFTVEHAVFLCQMINTASDRARGEMVCARRRSFVNGLRIRLSRAAAARLGSSCPLCAVHEGRQVGKADLYDWQYAWREARGDQQDVESAIPNRESRRRFLPFDHGGIDAVISLLVRLRQKELFARVLIHNAERLKTVHKLAAVLGVVDEFCTRPSLPRCKSVLFAPDLVLVALPCEGSRLAYRGVLALQHARRLAERVFWCITAELSPRGVAGDDSAGRFRLRDDHCIVIHGHLCEGLRAPRVW